MLRGSDEVAEYDSPSCRMSRKDERRLKKRLVSRGQLRYPEVSDAFEEEIAERLDRDAKEVSHLGNFGRGRRDRSEGELRVEDDEPIPVVSEYESLLKTFKVRRDSEELGCFLKRGRVLGARGRGGGGRYGEWLECEKEGLETGGVGRGEEGEFEGGRGRVEGWKRGEEEELKAHEEKVRRIEREKEMGDAVLCEGEEEEGGQEMGCEAFERADARLRWLNEGVVEGWNGLFEEMWESLGEEVVGVLSRGSVREGVAGVGDGEGGEEGVVGMSGRRLKMTKLQSELFRILTGYVDTLWASRIGIDRLESMSVVALHVVDHVLNAQSQIRSHSAVLARRGEERRSVIQALKRLRASTGAQSDQMEAMRDLPAELSMRWRGMTEREDLIKELQAHLDREEEEYRDQGFTRPKVLVLLPMRNAAMQFVELVLKLVSKTGRSQVVNKRKFFDEYFCADFVPRSNKSELWHALFQGSTDDVFRLGISFAPRHVVLYSDFYVSDIIVASPLGLRLSIQNNDHDTDYLSSIEIAVVDSYNVLLMQNWDHVKWVFDRLSKIPSSPDRTDFGRVRPYYLNDQAAYYRQTVMLGNYVNADVNALFNRTLKNARGKVRIHSLELERGCIDRVTSFARQVFYRLDVDSHDKAAETRLDYFKSHLYRQITSEWSAGTLIFIPCYFDYVQIRNFFKKQLQDDAEFVASCEYTKEWELARNQRYFKKGKSQIMLYTERLYFYKGDPVVGVKNILFYAPPFHAHYYAELVNMVPQDGVCCTLYSRYDLLQMEPIIGKSQTKEMLRNSKKVHSLLR
ncbi:uncharacterized protein LOC126317001 [Schistocerca gregaria]|uniref:uncharacterized protein LOC126317001 n=1 Tax=Schistocerca gregaria TaxID=7010 RepID=UPI00211DAFA2|nr:uncharacterized protein LOC126317001 [Schistocerca gregaria]